jgi:hypothetical protein
MIRAYQPAMVTSELQIFEAFVDEPPELAVVLGCEQ